MRRAEVEIRAATSTMFAANGSCDGFAGVRETVDSVTYPSVLRLASRNMLTGDKVIARSPSKSLFASTRSRLMLAIGYSDITR